ncbi:MAG TPA: hypothetical protein HPP83_10050 [Candidatus Hydrogenedentes bacterium]|nr:hypothetical protein [Candidatus Hydrogenedentota bacterium]
MTRGIAVTFSGALDGGALAPEANHPYGQKTPEWFSAEELGHVKYHPPTAVRKTLGLDLS